MSNRTKEAIAVNAIIYETTKEGSFLVPNIPVGDKAPSFDGQITVFKDDTESKESYINDVPTQVKGTGVEKFTDATIRFTLNIDHYKNFYKRGGCLLLVVEILENRKTKIFYKQLLPIELKQIIGTNGHKKSTSIELRPLEETSLYLVCRNFVEQMIKQPQILIEKNKYKDEDYEQLIFNSLTFNPNKTSFFDIFNHDFILFGLKDNIEYPLRTAKIDTIGITKSENINVNGKVFDVSVESKYKPPLIKKLIEGALEFIIDPTNNKLNFTIVDVNSVATQLKVLPLLIEFLKAGEIRFTEFYGKVPLEEGKKYLEDLENTYKLFIELEKIFIDLNIDGNTQFGNTDNIYNEIQQLIEIMINKDYSTVNVMNPTSPSFIRFIIGDVYILLFYNPNSVHKFINAFSKEVLDLPVALVFNDTENDTEEVIPISPYFLLEKETLINAKNINFDVIMQSFDSINYEKSDVLFAPINNFCLECLSAYDVIENKNILKVPLFLLNKMKNVTSDKYNKKIITINYLQTKYRLNGELSEEDYKNLTNLKDNAPSKENSLELKFCKSVLLQSKNEANILFKDFDAERSAYYKSLPIYSLYKKL